jgi:hypothetical protein
MAGFHFFLPVIFHWGLFTVHLDPPLHWALFSLNFFFSSLLLMAGAGTFVAAAPARSPHPLARLYFVAVGVFWLLNTGYQVVSPFPHPMLRWVFMGYGALAASLYLLPVLRRPARPDGNG